MAAKSPTGSAIAHVESYGGIERAAVRQRMDRRRRGTGERQSDIGQLLDAAAQRERRPFARSERIHGHADGVARMPELENVDQGLPVGRTVLECLEVHFADALSEEIAERVLRERHGMCVLPVVADRDEVLSCRRSRGRRRLHGRHRHGRDEPCGRECLKQHPFKDNVNRVSDRILAAVMTAPRQPIDIREYPRPDLPPGSALLRTMSSEVCGTDVHLWHGRLAGVPYPIIPGHVSAGVIEAVRGPLTGIDGAPIREGDRAVSFDVHRTCGRCRACTVHRTPTRCAARRVYGITDSAEDGLFGGWAQAIYLEPGVALARLPESVALDDYIGGGCGLLTAVHIAERAEIRLGDAVVVQGTGAVGLCAIALAKIAGASTIIALGAPDDRLQLAERMGADMLLDLASTSEAERLDR